MKKLITTLFITVFAANALAAADGIKKVFKEKSPERNFFFQGFEQIFGMFI